MYSNMLCVEDSIFRTSFVERVLKTNCSHCEDNLYEASFEPGNPRRLLQFFLAERWLRCQFNSAKQVGN